MRSFETFDITKEPVCCIAYQEPGASENRILISLHCCATNTEAVKNCRDLAL